MSDFDFVPGGWREPIYLEDFLVEVWRFQSVGRDVDARLLLMGIWAWAMDASAGEVCARIALKLFQRLGFSTDDDEGWSLLPEQFSIYRAETDPSGRGYSWTLDKEIADTLAGRHGLSVTQGTVKKRDVVAYITHNGEDEIIVARENVKPFMQ